MMGSLVESHESVLGNGSLTAFRVLTKDIAIAKAIVIGSFIVFFFVHGYFPDTEIRLGKYYTAKLRQLASWRNNMLKNVDEIKF
jgi:hypothetical protein